MNETQLPGMQSLARERVEPRFGATRLSISRIADQRMTDMRHMHADLVRAPGREFALDKRCASKALKNPITGQRLAPTRHNRHFCPLDRMPANRRIHLAAERWIAMHESKVVTLHGARLELTDEIGLRFKCFGNHQQATRILVETMHDPRPRQLPENRATIQQGIEQGSGPIPATGMDDQTNRLVDDDQRIVFENHLKWNVLRLFGKHRIGRFGTDEDRLAPPNLRLGIWRRATHKDSSRLEPGLQAAAGMFGKQASKRLIDPQAGAVVRNSLALRRSGRGGWAIIEPVFFQRVFDGAFHPA